MYVQRLLQISIAAIAAMGTMLLSMGQRDVIMPLVMIVAAGASVWLTDIKGLLRLNRTVANIAMLVAVVVSARQLISLGGEIQAVGLARFLIYMQIILLFQKKDAKTYWFLIMLSLLQVVVSALFTQGIFFGLMLIFYMLTASLGLTLLLFHSHWEQFSAGEKSMPVAAPGRWPLAGQKPNFVSVAASGSETPVGRELYGLLTGIGMRTIGVTALLFVFLPRFNQVGWINTFMQAQQTVGFNADVALGEMGQIIEDADEIMRISFYDQASGAALRPSGAVYLRGAVLMTYSNGHWRAGRPTGSSGTSTLTRTRKPLPANLLRQECIIESLDRPELFYVAPYVPIKSDDNIVVDKAYLRLLRSEHRRNRQFTYNLGTTAIVNGVQQPLVPGSEMEDVDRVPLRIPPPDASSGLPNLMRLAQQWIEQSNIPQQDRAGRAKHLQRMLAEFGLFRYSLEGPDRDPHIDPIEDFVTNHRVGHCEYFATALTLMLRSQNIPARMVVGYRTDEWNQVGQYYQVRQLHAHTWVECWLQPDQIPPDLLHGSEFWPWSQNGAWLQLDPTPESDVQSQTRWYTPINDTFQWLDFAWSYYVVELDFQRQRDVIFLPILKGLEVIYGWLTDAQTWRYLFDLVGGALHLGGWPGVIAWVLFVITCLATIVLLWLLCLLVYRLGYMLWLRFSGGSGKARAGRTVQVVFYSRLEALLATHGLVRSAGQTQREFASMAGASLAALCGQSSVALLPVQVAEAFYRVRFGRIPLDRTRSETVQQALDQIAAIDQNKFSPG